jgi:hypothetical protein
VEQDLGIISSQRGTTAHQGNNTSLAVLTATHRLISSAGGGGACFVGNWRTDYALLN